MKTNITNEHIDVLTDPTCVYAEHNNADVDQDGASNDQVVQVWTRHTNESINTRKAVESSWNLCT